MDNKRTTNGQQTDTNKNVKNVRINKELYSECVLLSKEEHKKLINKYGENLVGKAIELLNNYIKSSGKRYKSHYHTLLLWPMQRAQEGNNGKGVGSISRPWVRRPGEELSADAENALAEVKRLERERASRLAAADHTTEDA